MGEAGAERVPGSRRRCVRSGPVPPEAAAAPGARVPCGQPPCTVAMEACGNSHHRAREISGPGHQVRLIPPADVKPCVKRQKTDAAAAGTGALASKAALIGT